MSRRTELNQGRRAMRSRSSRARDQPLRGGAPRADRVREDSEGVEIGTGISSQIEKGLLVSNSGWPKVPEHPITEPGHPVEPNPLGGDQVAGTVDGHVNDALVDVAPARPVAGSQGRFVAHRGRPREQHRRPCSLLPGR